MPFRLTIQSVPVVIHTNTRPLRWMGKLGITLGRHIFLAPPAVQVWPALIAHEFAHVLQWRELGAWRFLWTYVRGLLTHGYGLKHPLERDAHAYDTAAQSSPVFVDAARAIGGRW